MKFPGVIAIDKIDVHTKGQAEVSKVKVTEIKTNVAPIHALPDCIPSLTTQMATKWCTNLAVA